MSVCSHLEQIRVAVLPAAIDGCEAEPGEDWSWCFLDEVAFVVGQTAPDLS